MTRKSKPPIAIYSALADATRCRIVEILLAGPIPVHKLADAFAISRPAISRHLRVLKTAGLVAEVKKGRENLYALRPAKLGGAVAWINSVVVPSEASAEERRADQPAAKATVLGEVPMPTAPLSASSVSNEPVSVESEMAIVETPEPPAKPERAPRSARPVPRPEPAVNQMGFDF